MEEIQEATGIDPWFLYQLLEIVDQEAWYGGLDEVGPAELRLMKRNGFSDVQLADLRSEREDEVRIRRWEWDIRPTYNVVDTCAGEFPAETPYYYSSYEQQDESNPSEREKIIVLGSGPNRIGQGIEFDYCCVQAVLALREAGYETIMVNSNPETVSTDFDVSDKLYFEPLTFEDVLEIVEREQPLGVVVQLGGQTPLNLAGRLEAAGVPILGTSVDAHRSGRTPGPLRGGLQDRRSDGAQKRNGNERGAGTRGGRGRRVPGARAPELRTRGPGNGDRLR